MISLNFESFVVIGEVRQVRWAALSGTWYMGIYEDMCIIESWWWGEDFSFHLLKRKHRKRGLKLVELSWVDGVEQYAMYFKTTCSLSTPSRIIQRSRSPSSFLGRLLWHYALRLGLSRQDIFEIENDSIAGILFLRLRLHQVMISRISQITLRAF